VVSTREDFLPSNFPQSKQTPLSSNQTPLSDFNSDVGGPVTLAQPTFAQPPGAVPSDDAGEGSDPTASRGEMGLFDTIINSIFGKPDPNTWRPLPLSTFFSEGWFEPWVPSPNGSGGAPRQGWINAMDGNMYRLWFFTFAEGFNQSTSNAYLGAHTLYTPLSRRLELITNIPFVVANNVSCGLPIINPTGRTARILQSQTTFGDISFTPRILLHETQDFTLTSEMAVVTPTGSSPLGGKPPLSQPSASGTMSRALG
jgi:hypothetical protein